MNEDKKAYRRLFLVYLLGTAGDLITGNSIDKLLGRASANSPNQKIERICESERERRLGMGMDSKIDYVYLSDAQARSKGRNVLVGLCQQALVNN